MSNVLDDVLKGSERAWGDPTFWETPDHHVGFSLTLHLGDKRAATIYGDAVNHGALKAALITAAQAVDVQAKKIVPIRSLEGMKTGKGQ